MGAIDDPAVVGGVRVSLSAQLEAKVLDDICVALAYVMCKRVAETGETHRQEDGRVSWQRWSS